MNNKTILIIGIVSALIAFIAAIATEGWTKYLLIAVAVLTGIQSYWGYKNARNGEDEIRDLKKKLTEVDDKATFEVKDNTLIIGKQK